MKLRFWEHKYRLAAAHDQAEFDGALNGGAVVGPSRWDEYAETAASPEAAELYSPVRDALAIENSQGVGTETR